MRTFAFVCLLLSVSACRKFAGDDILPKGGIAEVSHDTIPDHARFTLRLSMDNTDYDETLFLFDRKAGTAFSPDNDASYFPGFGQVSLASISSDGRDMAVYSLPYKSGMSVGLQVHSKKDAMLNLQLYKAKDIPASIRIWVKDNYSKDSTDLCKAPYSFKICEADTNSFGNKRLSLVLVNGPPVWSGQ
jgi:hypothetical protein